jgi:hypothetical protein
MRPGFVIAPRTPMLPRKRPAFATWAAPFRHAPLAGLARRRAVATPANKREARVACDDPAPAGAPRESDGRASNCALQGGGDGLDGQLQVIGAVWRPRHFSLAKSIFGVDPDVDHRAMTSR